MAFASIQPVAAATSALPEEPFGGVYFVTQQYRDLLGREPDAAGLEFWVSALDGGLPPTELVSSFVNSAEFAQVRTPAARLYLAALDRFPEHLSFHAAPHDRSELDAARAEVLSRVDSQFWGYGGGGVRISMDLKGSALPLAEGIVADFGPMLGDFTVGVFPYPMPDPVPESLCRPEDQNVVDPGGLGITIDLDLPATAIAGDRVSGTFTATNYGSQTYTLSWGAEVIAYVGDGGQKLSVAAGAFNLPLTIDTLAPGDTISGPIVIGTDACDPSVGHVLPADNYFVWGSITATEGADTEPSSNTTWVQLRLPGDSLALTN